MRCTTLIRLAALVLITSAAPLPTTTHPSTHPTTFSADQLDTLTSYSDPTEFNDPADHLEDHLLDTRARIQPDRLAKSKPTDVVDTSTSNGAGPDRTRQPNNRPAPYPPTSPATYDLRPKIAQFNVGKIEADPGDEDDKKQRGKSRVLSPEGVEDLPHDLTVSIGGAFPTPRVPSSFFQLSDKATFDQVVHDIAGACSRDRCDLPGEAGMVGDFLQDVLRAGSRIIETMFGKISIWVQVGTGPPPQTDLLLKVAGKNIALIEVKTQIAMKDDHVQYIFDNAADFEMKLLQGVYSLVDSKDTDYEDGTMTRTNRKKGVIMLEQVIAQMYEYNVNHAALTNFDSWVILRKSGSKVTLWKRNGRTNGKTGRSTALDIILDLSFKGLLSKFKSYSKIK